MSQTKNISLRAAILGTFFTFAASIVIAGTVTVQHGTLTATLGAPVNFSYTPDWYVVNDPTHTIGLGLRPYATLGSTMASLQCQGAANLSVSQNPGWNTLSLTASSGTATMNLGLTAGLDIEFIAFGQTLQGSLNNTPNWGFFDSEPFSTYLLNNPVTLSGQISQNLVSLNTLDALTAEFGFVIPSWLAGINLNINAVANLNQSIKGANISTSAGAIWSEGQTLNVYLNGGSYQLQNVQETWSDSATLSLGLGADMSADLLDGVLSVQLVDFGNVTLITAQQNYQLQSSPISTVQFDLSTGGVSTAPVINSISPSTLTGLPTGQTQLIRIIGSGFAGSPTLTFNDGVDSPFTGRVPTVVSANELDYSISTGTNQANWAVIVVNGSQTSNVGHFTVNAPPANPTGSLVVNLSPAGAISAGAQWNVDGGAYSVSGGVVTALTPGSHTVSFKSVSGYTTPANQSVNITANAQATSNASYSAIAASTYTLTLNYNNTQGGASPSPLASGNIYTAGTVVQLYASASSGYHFTGWGGDASGTANPITITVNANKNVTANFASGDPNMGTIIVNIQPAGAVTAGVQWGWNSTDFRNSGTSYTTFPGSYYIVLHPVDGWLSPFGVGGLFPVTLTAGQTTNYTVTFTQDTTPGLLTVTLSPPSAVTAGAQWHVNGGAAQGSGATVSLLPGTNYTVTFDSVSGWTAPASQTVTVQRSQTTIVPGNYTPPVGQPVIGSIYPPIGSMSGGTLLTINGVNFSAPATVLVGGQQAANVNVSSATQITCVTPSNSVYGSVPVILKTSGGSATNLNGFAYGMVTGSNLDLVSSVSGSAYGVAVQGNYAYVGEGRTLLVMNVSTPSSPSKVGQVYLPCIVRGVALFGNYAYVADEEGGLQVVDISIPTAPAIRGFYPSTSWSDGIAILGGRAYVADEGAGLEVFDLGNPTVPTLLSSTNCGAGESVVVNASTNGVFAYLTTGGSLCVIDVSNPLSPVLRGQTSIGSYTYSIAMSGNYVYAASLFGNLEIVDVSNPNAPSDIGHAPTIFFPNAVTVANNLVYAISSAAGSGFEVFSISGNTLSLVGKAANLTSSGYNLVVSGSTAYIAARDSGFIVANVSNPNSPSSLAAFTDSGSYAVCEAVAVTGNILCASDGSNLKIFDVSQPSSPALLSNFGGAGAGNQVLAKSGIAYLKSSVYGTAIINVSTPTSPQLIANIPVATIQNYKMALVGNMLYVAGQNGSAQPRFMAFDVSTPSTPTIRGTLDFGGFAAGSIAQAVAVNGTKALVGTESNSGQAEVSVLDISNLGAPVQVGSLTNVYAQDIRISANGNYAYMTDYNMQNALHIVDVSNPANPTLVTNLTLDGTTPTGLEIVGSELFAATFRNIYVFDISNPASPVLTRSYSASEINGIAVPNDSVSQSGNIYFADLDGGVVALKEKDLQAPDIFITNPTFESIYTNATSSLNLGGGSDDNVGVTGITWANSRGGGGAVNSPFDNWFVSGITLLPGTNILTVNAFDKAGNSGSDTLTVIYPSTNQNQTITFPAIADHTFGDAPITLAAAASSGLPVSFRVISGSATVSNNVLTLGGAGAITVEANQSGNNSFNPAPPVDINFNVARANQSIAFDPIPNHSAGDAPFALTAATSSGLPVYFNVLSGPAINSSNMVTVLGGGSATVIAWQPGNSNYNAAATVQQSFTVTKVPQTISFGALSQQKAGDASFSLAATADSGLPVSFAVSGAASLSGNIVTLTGSGNVTVTASQPGNNTYAAAANVTQSFFVVPPLNTLSSVGLLTNGFQMDFYGTIGSNYTLQASANLKNWTTVLNFTCTNSPVIVIDPGANYLGWRFYRVAQGTLPIMVQLNMNVPAMTKTNGFGLNLAAPLGFHYTIQASTNLANWQPLTNFVGNVSPLYFSDQAATNYNRRFYRAVMQ